MHIGGSNDPCVTRTKRLSYRQISELGSFGRGHPKRNALVALSSESPRLNRRKTPDFAAGTSMALNATGRLSAAREPEEMSLLRSCPGSCPWRNRYKDEDSSPPAISTAPDRCLCHRCGGHQTSRCRHLGSPAPSTVRLPAFDPEASFPSPSLAVAAQSNLPRDGRITGNRDISSFASVTAAASGEV